MKDTSFVFVDSLNCRISDFVTASCLNNALLAQLDCVATSFMSCYTRKCLICPFVQGELPLVGNVAPDFEAEAVFDQEFINVTKFMCLVFVLFIYLCKGGV